MPKDRFRGEPTWPSSAQASPACRRRWRWPGAAHPSTVLDAGRVIGEASGRNGGHCNSGLAHDFATLAGRLGTDKARAFYQAFAAAVDTVETVVKQEDIACDFMRTGKLKLASKPAHYDKLARTCEMLRREADPHVEMVPASGIRAEVGSGKFFGGLLQKTSAQMHVGKFGVGLAHAAARHGARIVEHAPVTQLDRQSDGSFRVTSARGSIDAGQVLLATGNPRTGPFSYLRRRMVSVGAFIIATEPLDAAVVQRLLPHRRNYVTSKNFVNYFRLTPDNRLVFGGRAPLRCRTRARTRRADASCVPRWKSSSPSCAVCASTTVGAGWST